MLVELDMKKNLAAGLPMSVRQTVNIGLERAGVTLARDGSLEGSQWLPHMEPLS